MIICHICRKPPFATRMDPDSMPRIGERCERSITDDVQCSGKYIEVLTDAEKEAKGQATLFS